MKTQQRDREVIDVIIGGLLEVQTPDFWANIDRNR